MRLAKTLAFHISLFLFFLSPSILRLYPGPYTTPLADAVGWLADRIMQGVASFAFLFALTFGAIIACKFYQWLTSAAAPAPSSPSPTELEEGTATTLATAVEPDADGTPAAAPAPASWSHSPTLASVIIGFLLSSGYVAWDVFFTNGLISSSKSVLENVGDVLLYLLRGWEVIFVSVLVGCVVVRVLRTAQWAVVETETQTAAPEVLFEGTLPEEDESTEKQTEKA
ncbi:hypothetical protein C8R45DRAFT_1013294 [Mycena sanguinolenta]|nr:hypothetical protein C8R45DRAFT_1013294 [Mycena sanguinolenta]